MWFQVSVIVVGSRCGFQVWVTPTVPGAGCRRGSRYRCRAITQRDLLTVHQKATQKSRSCPFGQTFNMPAFPFLPLYMHCSNSAFFHDYGPEQMCLNKKGCSSGLTGVDVGFILLLPLSIKLKKSPTLRMHGLRDSHRQRRDAGSIVVKPTIEEQTLVDQALSTLKEFWALWGPKAWRRL